MSFKVSTDVSSFKSHYFYVRNSFLNFGPSHRDHLYKCWSLNAIQRAITNKSESSSTRSNANFFREFIVFLAVTVFKNFFSYRLTYIRTSCNVSYTRMYFEMNFQSGNSVWKYGSKSEFHVNFENSYFLLNILLHWNEKIIHNKHKVIHRLKRISECKLYPIHISYTSSRELT